MSLFGSKKRLEEEGQKIALFRLALIMTGKSLDESRSLEREAFGKTLDELEDRGYTPRIVAKNPDDGSYWTVRGRAQGKLAIEIDKGFPSDPELEVEKFLKKKGYKDLEIIHETIDSATSSRQIRYYDEFPGNPYRLSRFKSCLGDELGDGKRAWLFEYGLFDPKRKKECQIAAIWLALMELGVPEQMAESFILGWAQRNR